jgi:serine/threonine protein kinase
MGVVYLGFDPMLDRPVAIKVLKVPDEETRRRFLREARLAARVHHPHIVSIYAVGEHEGNPYLAMEFIAGRTMAQVIRSGDDIPLARKVHWLSELCAGLGHAHESGIVHRDVKPSNLLIAQNSGTLRLLDFGIAHGNEASGMTMAGMIVGTPQYMSPEQITGQAVDARSDIFSVGAVAYELLTGRQAFGGDNLYHVSRQIVGEQPRPIESIVPDVPHALVKAIAKCLQKEPAARAESARLLEREFLSIARRLDPEHTLVVLPAEPTMVAPQVKDATTSRRELLREAQEAIEQGQLTTASGLLQKLESGTSPNPDVQQLRHRLQSRRLELRVHEAVSRADEASQTGSIEEAEAAINALAELSPRHPALERLRHAHQERIDERQVAALTSRARQALQQDRLDEAESLIAEALALAPDAPDALAVQQKLSDRTRAQRIARLVAQASRALDQDDIVAASRAIDALVKIDASHRDVARLQARLHAVRAEADDAQAHAHPARAVPVPVVAPPPVVSPAPPVPAPAAASAAAPAPRKAPVPVAPPAPPAPASPAAAPVRATSPQVHSPTADGLLLRPPVAADPQADARHGTPAPDASTSSRSPLVPALVVLALLLAAGAGAYYMFGRSPEAAASASGPSATTTAGPAAVTPPDATPASSMTPVTSVETPVPDPVAGDASPVPVPGVVPPPVAPRGDPWASVRQFAAAGKYDRAIVAIDQVRGVPEALMQEERSRVVENARRYTLAARRGAEDLRLTRSPQYAQGVTRQEAADRQRAGGQLKSAVTSYMAARGHFLQAFNDSGKAAPIEVVAAPPVPEPAAPPAAPAQAPAPSTVDLSTWSNDEARASIAQFCGAYLARDMGGLNRLWPNMGPEWRTELKEAFSTSGELVCVFENVTLVRTSDEFNATARLLTQLPGGEQRRRSLVLSLVPARDRLVIGNIRVR